MEQEMNHKTRIVLIQKFEKSASTLPNPATWELTPDPYILPSANGIHLYKFDTIRFTIFVSDDIQYTLSWNATSLGWQVGKAVGWMPPDIFVEIKDVAGGVLDIWDIGHPDQPCGGPYPIVFTNKNGKTDILEAAINIGISFGSASWVNC